MPGPVSDAEAEAIVRDLAALPDEDEGSLYVDYLHCWFCFSVRDEPPHEDDCLWRRAREWVDNHPDPVDPT